VNDKARQPMSGPTSTAGTTSILANVGVSGQTFSALSSDQGAAVSFPEAATVPSADWFPASGAANPPVPVKRRGGRASAIDVARMLVYLAACEEEPDYLTHLRLQKLLYYVQGWSLAMRNKPMFNGRIEAWAHGPVVKEVYFALAVHGSRPIMPDAIGVPETLTTGEMEFIQSVWESYKRFSAGSLREMSHKEAPWVDARNGLSPAERCEHEITHDAMRRFFSSLAK
jgi:uncharacterized phage-associated protein